MTHLENIHRGTVAVFVHWWREKLKRIINLRFVKYNYTLFYRRLDCFVAKYNNNVFTGPIEITRKD